MKSYIAFWVWPLSDPLNIKLNTEYQREMQSEERWFKPAGLYQYFIKQKFFFCRPWGMESTEVRTNIKVKVQNGPYMYSESYLNLTLKSQTLFFGLHPATRSKASSAPVRAPAAVLGENGPQLFHCFVLAHWLVILKSAFGQQKPFLSFSKRLENCRNKKPI